MTLRLCRTRRGDADAVREICIRTGDAGRDSTGALPDAGILADVHALPYWPAHPTSPPSSRTHRRAPWWLRPRPRRLRAPGERPAPARGPARALDRRVSGRSAHRAAGPATGPWLGRPLLEPFYGDAAATGVHLGGDARNTAAPGFYARVGVTRLGTDPGVTWFGRRLLRPAHWGGVRAGC